MQNDPKRENEAPRQLARLLERVIPQYGSVIRRVLSELDGERRMTIPQFRALQAIHDRGAAGALNLELARQLGVAAPSMTAMIDGLVDRGLVDRSVDPENRRQVNIVLTPRGQERFETLTSEIETRLAEGFDGLTPKELRYLIDAVSHLDSALQRLGQLPSREND